MLLQDWRKYDDLCATWLLITPLSHLVFRVPLYNLEAIVLLPGWNTLICVEVLSQLSYICHNVSDNDRLDQVMYKTESDRCLDVQEYKSSSDITWCEAEFLSHSVSHSHSIAVIIQLNYSLKYHQIPDLPQTSSSLWLFLTCFLWFRHHFINLSPQDLGSGQWTVLSGWPLTLPCFRNLWTMTISVLYSLF